MLGHRFVPGGATRSLLASIVSVAMSMAPAWALAAEPVPVQSPSSPAPPVQSPDSSAPPAPTVQPPSSSAPTSEPTAEPPSTPSAEVAEGPTKVAEGPTKVAEDPAEAPAAYGVMIEQGQALIAQGHPAEGARQLSDAYVAMPAALRVGDWGRDVVVQASDAFEAAGAAGPDLALLDAEQALLTAYFADLGEARAAGRPTAAADEREDALGQRLAEVEQALAQRKGAPGGDEVGPIDGLGPVAPPDPRQRLVARILVGAGAVGAVGGGVMVVVGAVAASRAEEQRPLAGPEDKGEIRQTKLAGTLMATFGALIFSGSVMMLGVGTNRLGELREGGRISVVPIRRGLALHGRF